MILLPDTARVPASDCNTRMHWLMCPGCDPANTHVLRASFPGCPFRGQSRGLLTPVHWIDSVKSTDKQKYPERVYSSNSYKNQNNLYPRQRCRCKSTEPITPKNHNCLIPNKSSHQHAKINLVKIPLSWFFVWFLHLH